MSNVDRWNFDAHGKYADRDGRFVYYSDYSALHSLLVKACVEIAVMACSSDTWATGIIESIIKDYGIRLRWTGATFEEDTTK